MNTIAVGCSRPRDFCSAPDCVSDQSDGDQSDCHGGLPTEERSDGVQRQGGGQQSDFARSLISDEVEHYQADEDGGDKADQRIDQGPQADQIGAV